MNGPHPNSNRKLWTCRGRDWKSWHRCLWPKLLSCPAMLPIFGSKCSGMVVMVEIDCFIGSISSALVKRSDNYWSASNEAVVSYPEDAHSFFEPIEENSYWFAHRNSCIISVARQFPPAGWVIDVGGGNGFVSLCLKNQEIKTIVMEPGSGAHTALGRGLPVIKASLESAQFYDNSVPA